MGWSDALSKIPELLLKAANLAEDMKKVQQNVEDLQKQNHDLTAIVIRKEEQIKQLQEDSKKQYALIERLLKLENELSTLKNTHEANNHSHTQTIKIGLLELEKQIHTQVKEVENGVAKKFSKIETEFRTALYEYTSTQAPPSEKFTPLPAATTSAITSDNNDEKSES